MQNHQNDPSKDKTRAVSIGRHMSQCTICRSTERQAIEEKWIAWTSTTTLAAEYTKLSRDSIYRHMHAMNLFPKRQSNVLMALEQIIERVDQTPMNGSVVLSAIKLYFKVTGAGRVIEPAEGTDCNELFARMSKEEREAFLQRGSLPEWLTQTNGTTPTNGQEGPRESGDTTQTNGIIPTNGQEGPREGGDTETTQLQ